MKEKEKVDLTSELKDLEDIVYSDYSDVAKDGCACDLHDSNPYVDNGY